MTPPRVDSYHFGRIVIDGKPYSRDVIIFPDRVVANWWRDRGHYLQPEDLVEVLAEKPEVLVVGQGAVGRMSIAPEATQALAKAGIELIAERSGPACETYNRLSSQKRAALAIHLTC